MSETNSRIEASEIKQRVSLLDLLERCGIQAKKSGAAHVCCCPFHKEKTGSFVVHEKAEGDWFHCFGCGAKGDIFAFWQEIQSVDFIQAREQLARIGGLLVGEVPIPVPRRIVATPEPDAPVVALSIDEMRRWERACTELYTDKEDFEKLAKWRGYRPEVVEWAARRGVIGRLLDRGDWREAFLIQRPVETKPMVWDLESIGWHVRLAPGSRGNNDKTKASFRYGPRTGLGAWPFVVLPPAGAGEVLYWFMCEGQWDALALVDLMGWDKDWPETVGLMGMRGASSWKRAMEYPLRVDAAAILVADNDDTGKGWFIPTDKTPVSFAMGLEERVRSVYGFWPAEWSGQKDLNDVLRILDKDGRTLIRGMFQAKVQPNKKLKPFGPTFFIWLKKQVAREDEVGGFAKWVSGRSAPKGRVRESIWLSFLHRSEADKTVEAGFLAAWTEWSELSRRK